MPRLIGRRAGRGETAARRRGPTIKTNDLYYELPPELIAQHPRETRDASRLLVLDRAGGGVEHRAFRDLPGFLRPGDCLVLNRTRVLPARFVARRATGGRLGGLFVHETAAGRWQVMLAGARRVRTGERLRLADSRWSMVLARRLDRGLCEVRVEPPDPAAIVLGEVGLTPLPPYIQRKDEDQSRLEHIDRRSYQTVYAEVPGAVAAPTAGLHFTEAILETVRSRGVHIAQVVLHVGPGTFQPVEVKNLADHPMHAEWYELAPGAADRINATRATGGRVVAVGTTVVRVLESCWAEGALRARRGWTDLLIYPPYAFRAVDVLLTNFHLPGSTLLALVAAFAGLECIRAAYRIAIQQRYRFYSYGDAMLIL